MGFKRNYFHNVFTLKMNRFRHERNFHAVEKNYPFLLATIVNLAVYCYQNYSSVLNQIIKNLTIYVGIVGLVFVNLKISRITCNRSIGYLF